LQDGVRIAGGLERRATMIGVRDVGTQLLLQA
jgi:hypothetical protein